MLEIYAYNAGKGDCIRIRFGDKHNIFIDTGVMRFGHELRNIWNDIVSSGETLDVLILTHIDNDHIGGILSLLRLGYRCLFKEVWMNYSGSSYTGDAMLSTRENNELYGILLRQGVKIRSATEGEQFDLEGALINILNPSRQTDMDKCAYSPSRDTMLAGHSDYGISLSELANRKIIKHDRSIPNKNSIVFIFEYNGKRLLFTGDAWAEDVCKATGKFDLLKLPHHGSVRNISEDYPHSFVSHVFMICTDGREHPDKQTIAKLEKWYGEISIYSPTAWWQHGYFGNGDKEHKIHYFQKEGLVISW